MRHVMKLFRRHYGKLAAAVLLTLALNILWCTLPVQPRVVCQLPEQGYVCGSSQNGGLILTKTDSWDGAEAYPIRFWDVKSGRQAAACTYNQLQSPHCTVLSNDNLWLATINEVSGRLAEVKIVELPKNRVQTSHADATPYARMHVRFSPNSQLLAAIPDPWPYELGNIRVWDVTTGKAHCELHGQSGPTTFSPDSRFLVTAGEAWQGKQDFDRRYLPDRRPRALVWNLATGEIEFYAQGPRQTDLAVAAFSADGKKLALVWKPVDIRPDLPLHLDIWDVAKGQPIASRPGLLQHLVYCHAEARLEELFLADVTPGGIEILDVVTGNRRFTMSDFESGARIEWPQSVATGRFIATTCKVSTTFADWHDFMIEKLPFLSKFYREKTIRFHLWDTATGEHLPAVPLAARQSSIEVSSDGRCFFFQPDYRTIEIWDLPPRKPLGWFLTLAGVLLLLTLGGFWWQTRRRKRQAALATEAIPCGT